MRPLSRAPTGCAYTPDVRQNRVRWGLTVAFALTVAGCTSSDDQVASTAPATAAASSPADTEAPGTAAPGTDAPVTTDSLGTTIAPSTTVIDTTTDAPTTTVQRPVISDAPCTFAPLGDRGSTITFVRDSKVYELSSDWTTGSCLADAADGGASSLQWSPSGEAVLLDSARVLDATGIRETGYLADNTGVSWSYPTGKALIAPAVADGALLWRTAGEPGTRRDISFLQRTDVAAYHVAGKNVFAAGVDPNGLAGIFVASNRGDNVRTVATLDDPSTRITELASDISGQQLYIVHDHGSMWELHVIQFPGLALGTFFDTPEPISHLTVDEISGNVAVQVGDCSGITHVLAPSWGLDPVAANSDLSALSTTPIGWLNSNQLVVAARPTGCTGPADIWVVDSSGSLHWVLSGVELASVRSKVGTFGELPDDINAQAPG